MVRKGMVLARLPNDRPARFLMDDLRLRLVSKRRTDLLDLGSIASQSRQNLDISGSLGAPRSYKQHGPQGSLRERIGPSCRRWLFAWRWRRFEHCRLLSRRHSDWQNRGGIRRLGPLLADGAVLSGLLSRDKDGLSMFIGEGCARAFGGIVRLPRPQSLYRLRSGPSGPFHRNEAQ